MPTWGAWVDDRFYFEGSPATRRARNIAANPAVVVHIERGDDAVIVEAMAKELRNVEPELTARLRDGFAKYRASHGYDADPDHWRDGGLWEARPMIAFGWSRFPADTTRWSFDE